MAVLWTVIGLGLLVVGGEALVRGSVAVARSFGVSPLVIGITLVGFGTSVPELVTSLEAAPLNDLPGIALGNIVGTNVANVLLILGGSAAITPIMIHKQAFHRDGGVLTAATLLLVVAVVIGGIEPWMGFLWVVGLVAYTVLTYRAERRRNRASLTRHAAEDAMQAVKRIVPWSGALLAVGGIVAVVFGANFLVDGAVDIAAELGVSETVIGLETLVALGTSMPELVTTLRGLSQGGRCRPWQHSRQLHLQRARHPRRHRSRAAAPVAAEIAAFDIWVLAATTVALVVFAITDWRLSRREGFVLLAGYAVYLAAQLSPGLRTAIGIP